MLCSPIESDFFPKEKIYRETGVLTPTTFQQKTISFLRAKCKHISPIVLCNPIIVDLNKQKIFKITKFLCLFSILFTRQMQVYISDYFMLSY